MATEPIVIDPPAGMQHVREGFPVRIGGTGSVNCLKLPPDTVPVNATQVTPAGLLARRPRPGAAGQYHLR